MQPTRTPAFVNTTAGRQNLSAVALVWVLVLVSFFTATALRAQPVDGPHCGLGFNLTFLFPKVAKTS